MKHSSSGDNGAKLETDVFIDEGLVNMGFFRILYFSTQCSKRNLFEGGVTFSNIKQSLFYLY